MIQDDTRLRPTTLVAGFLLAALILGGLVAVVGVGDVVATLATANRVALVGLLGLSLLWTLAWSVPMHLVLGTLGVQTSLRRSVLVYANLMFANDVAPFSVLGAEPIATVLVSRGTRTTYERSFAAVTSVEVLNFLPAPAFAVFGLLYFVVTTTLGKAVEVVVLSLMGIVVLFLVIGAVSWAYRESLATAVVGHVARLEARLARRLPRVRLPAPDVLRGRIDTVLETLELVASDRRTLVVGGAASTVGWAVYASMLWLALWAVGHPVPVEAPLFVVPLATVTDIVPVPGGVGSVDAVLVVLLVATTGVPAAAATAAVLVYRAASYLFPILVGAVAVAVLQS